MQTTLKVGDDAVLGSMLDGHFHPLQFNSKHNKEHPCRGKVLKIGRKLIHIQGNEVTPWTALPYSPDIKPLALCALPVEQAKALYREMFKAKQDPRPAQVTDKFVEEL